MPGRDEEDHQTHFRKMLNPWQREGKGRVSVLLSTQIYWIPMGDLIAWFALLFLFCLCPTTKWSWNMVWNLAFLISDSALHLSCIAFAVVALIAQDTCRWWAGPEGFRPVNTRTFLELATCTTLCWQRRSYLPVQDISKFNSTYQVC